MSLLQSESTDNVLSHVRDTPLARLVQEQLLNSILKGDLLPGQRVNESAIAAGLGVSRMPVREALRDLENAGMVESRKHTGVFVRTLSAEEAAELYELRTMIESYVGRKVATQPAAALLQSLETRLGKMDDAAKNNNVAAYYEANLEFHWDIVSASQNREICQVYRGLVRKLHLVRLKNLSSDIGMTTSISEHHRIVEAIRSADPDACGELMTSHVRDAAERLHRLLSGQGAGTTQAQA
jgi:DNA-binding GntR family transcriptional regulator